MTFSFADTPKHHQRASGKAVERWFINISFSYRSRTHVVCGMCTCTIAAADILWFIFMSPYTPYGLWFTFTTRLLPPWPCVHLLSPLIEACMAKTLHDERLVWSANIVNWSVADSPSCVVADVEAARRQRVLDFDWRFYTPRRRCRCCLLFWAAVRPRSLSSRARVITARVGCIRTLWTRSW